MAWEPVPHFRALLSYNVAVNKVTHLVTVRHTVVAEPGSKQVRTALRTHCQQQPMPMLPVMWTRGNSHHSSSIVRAQMMLCKACLICCRRCCCQVVHAPNRGIWGTAGIDGANIDTGIQNDGEYLKVTDAMLGHY